MPSGLKLNESARRPSNNAATDLVVPHPGHGKPVTNLKGQTMGPELKSLLNCETIFTKPKLKIRNRSLTARLR